MKPSFQGAGGKRAKSANLKGKEWNIQISPDFREGSTVDSMLVILLYT
jgi:hypothetical protein